MQALDYLIIFCYLIITLMIGFMPLLFRKRKDINHFLFKNKDIPGLWRSLRTNDDQQSLEDYHLGNFPWWALGASGMASNVDIAGTMVIAALVYALGTQGFFIEIRGGIVLIMAFLMIFMGKWTRRAVITENGQERRVMTTAEWMIFRFGKGKGGDFARLISAVSNIVFAIGAMSYFSIGGGKFIGNLMGIDDRFASILLVVLAAVYTIASGFSGVIWTDVFQGLLILSAVIYISWLSWTTVTLPETFSVSIPDGDSFLIKDWNFADWSNIYPPFTADLPGNYAIFNLFGGVMLFYLLKTVIEGCSGAGGYMAQRYFAARSEQDTAFLSLFWIVSMAFRWPLIAAFAMLGIHYGLTQSSPITDPELILPIVIKTYVPTGLKGLLVACFMAAAMSTFSSIINASAAYWTNDIYEPYMLRKHQNQGTQIDSEEHNQKLVFQSRLASILIVGVGLFFSFNLSNINEIWGWLSLGLGVGLGIPLLLRWYWWEFNGYGFAWGTLGGMIAAILTKAVILPLTNNPQNQEYILFFVPAICSLLGCIIGTYATPEAYKTDKKVVENFYNTTKPFGFWGGFSKGLTREHKFDIISTFIAVPWQLSLFLLGMMIMMKNWDNVKILGLGFFLLSIALYFTWLSPIIKQSLRDSKKANLKEIEKISS
ncbi:sodium:solute symporter [Crocosphaera sp. UHCC 0190]|uniref:sodium:solute symporter family transporter n=1 Tax=Crocosphaera sp. UHCC 0190 TaxID=3110246 RepID=UPI002B20BADA|nr:sodium:solute symporter [Crocosphaera sp. UHCC 0190]MEA5512375.1 sodium:solute symporter [Crocosphaera sp. UHCC 0190]